MIYNEYGRLKKVLLAKPKYYSLLPINLTTKKYLEENDPPDLEKAAKEHDDFVQAYKDYGVEVVMFEPDPRYPYQAYTRDFALMTPKGAVISKMCKPGRIGEELIAENALIQAGVPVLGHITKGTCEGGDYMYLSENELLVGCGGRSSMEGINELQELLNAHSLNIEVIPVRFHADYVHLDCVGAIVGEKAAVCCLEVVPAAYINLLKDRGFTIIDFPVEDVPKMVSNVVPLDKETILTFKSNTRVNEKLKALGFKLIEVDMPQLLKAGGGPHCLTFVLERERN